MTDTLRGRLWPTRLAAGAALFIAGLGLTVLAGWVAQAPAMIQLLIRLPPMPRNAAACFVLCGLALSQVSFATTY